MPPGFQLLIWAQFASALADNALLIVTIALLQQLGLPGWWAPLLKFGFTVSYVVFAPFVGPLADAVPKARLMACMNGVKVIGVVALLGGLHPALAFAIVGFGAAAYAPAKYGLMTELVRPHQLVEANGWLEVSVVCAALLGTVAGGLLVSPWMLGPPLGVAGRMGDLPGMPGGTALDVSLWVLLTTYAVAALLNLRVPDSGIRYAASRMHPLLLMREFWSANKALWRDRDGGLSLAVTTIFWGVGATLQFAVLRWGADVLRLPLSQAAYLQAAVAVGVIAGATAAARWIALAEARRVLFAGVLLGLMMPLVASTSTLTWAVLWLVSAGAVGGVLVVPLNALLQHRGYKLFSAGRSIAIQGFNENASILAMLSVYACMLALEVPIVVVMWGFGLSIATAIGWLIGHDRARCRREPEASSG